MMESFKTTEEGPKMFDPVTLSLPLALAIIAALAAAAYAYRRWLESTIWIPWQTTPKPAPAVGGRHRLDDATVPFRDWAAIAAERLNEAARWDDVTSLPPVETAELVDVR